VAQRTQVFMVDDLDDTPINDGEGQTIKFALDGTNFEIDLNNDNAEAMREALSRYVSAGRKVSGSQSRTATSTPQRANKSDVDPKAVRAWAESNNVELSARGRIPASVIGQFKAAGN